MAGPGRLTWLKSSRCDTNACVEVAVTDDRVFVRDSKDPDGPRLTFTRPEWAEFLGWVGRGVPDETR
jgi:hypothetical protein